MANAVSEVGVVVADRVPEESPRGATSWGAVIAGAVAAAAATLVLMLVGAGLGLTTVSPFSNEGASLATAGQGFGPWEEDLSELLASSCSEARFGALQLLGAFARRSAGAGCAAIPADQLVELVPRELFRAEDAGLRRAAFELALERGGDAARELFVALLDDARVPRSEVLAALESASCARAGAPAQEAAR